MNRPELYTFIKMIKMIKPGDLILMKNGYGYSEQHYALVTSNEKLTTPETYRLLCLSGGRLINKVCHQDDCVLLVVSFYKLWRGEMICTS